MGLWTKIFGGADSCREAIRESYAKHVQAARQGKMGAANIEDAHLIGLYGALEIRYRVRGKTVSEAQILSELAPFYTIKLKGSASFFFTEALKKRRERSLC
jgi:hypothetical protein